MARKCLINKQRSEPKFRTRAYNRCQLCGRPRAYYRKFQICRVCFRNLASRGEIPGVKKASW
ncbi:MAG: type Z 30S ribosomal protein S14 [Planctomycetota bacterium]